MTDITAFPTLHRVLWSGNNIIPMTASGAITAGMVVAIDATGVSMTVRAAVAESGEMPIGVALYTVADGAEVAVCTIGCVCYVANADDTTGIDAGDILTTNDCAVGGTVIAAGAGTKNNVGIALDDIAGSGTGRALIIPGLPVET